MPNENINSFSKTIKWLMSENIDKYRNNSFFNIYRKLCETNYETPMCVLYEKVDNEHTKSFPSYTFLLFYGFFSYQIFIPFVLEDSNIFNEEKIVFPINEILNETYLDENGLEDIQVKKINLSEINKRVGQKMKFNMEYSEA